MKISIFIALMSCLFIYCSDNKTMDKYKLREKIEAETLSLDSFKINGVLPFFSTIEKYEKVLGKPMRIETINLDEVCVTMLKEPDRYLEFGAIRCEAQDKYVMFLKIDFQKDKNTFLSYKAKRFSSETTFEDFKKQYPIIQSYEIDEKKQVMAFLLCPICDDKFYFIFQNGKLVTCEYSMPC